ncbi:MAG: lysophospholipid acyltransferase family protein [Chloroflexaceae bacterium]
MNEQSTPRANEYTDAATLPAEPGLPGMAGQPASTDHTAPVSPAEQPSVMVNELAAEVHAIEIKVRNRAQQAEADTAQVDAFVADILKLIAENLERMAPPQVRFALDLLRKFDIDLEDYLSPDFWRGIGMLIGYQIKEQSAFIQRRLQGDYAIDPYGMDLEIIDIVRPFLSFMYRTWWRTTTEGITHVPASGRVLLVANHSGVLPWDGAMLATAVYEEHPSARIVRNLFLHWFSTLPFVAPLLADLGQVSGSPENAINLLENDELVCVFPEGVKGIGKLFQQRYRLARFGRGGFVQAALRTGAPLVPVTIIGAEEIYPLIANAKPIAQMLRMPYFPITPFFPWLGPLGALPLPTRWNISFGPPISTQEYGPDAADDPLIVFMLAEQVRSRIQETLDAKLRERTSIF